MQFADDPSTTGYAFYHNVDSVTGGDRTGGETGDIPSLPVNDADNYKLWYAQRGLISLPIVA